LAGFLRDHIKEGKFGEVPEESLGEAEGYQRWEEKPY
jgi:hypothetical protein